MTNTKVNDLSYWLRKVLRKLPLWVKIASLLVFGFLLFPFFIDDFTFRSYLYVLFSIVPIMAFLCYLIIYKEFKFIIYLWLIGSIIYLLITIPYIYTQHSICPYLKLDNMVDRWLYILAYPIRILGLFSVGLIFISIVSPIGFLKYGKFGYWLALLFRVIELAIQQIHETRIALLMQNNWPEEHKGLIRLNEAYLIIKNSPKLIITMLRNMIVWFPWAWLCFNRLKTNVKGDG